MSKRLALLILVALLFIGGGVAFLVAFMSTPPPQGSVTLQVNVPSELAQPSAPPCAEMFVPGKVVTIQGADFACKDPDGTMRFNTSFRCKDGRHLLSMTSDTGAPEGWAFSGEPYQRAVTDDVAADPGYGRAYEACL